MSTYGQVQSVFGIYVAYIRQNCPLTLHMVCIEWKVALAIPDPGISLLLLGHVHAQ